MESLPPVEQTSETGRVEAFSDAVFAIVITILGIELVAPTLQTPTGARLLAALAAQWPTYLVFTVSFVSILIMWMNHHGIFLLIQQADGELMTANGLLLLFVTAVPFATSVLIDYLNTPAASIAAAAYSALFVLLNAAYNLLWAAACKGRRLLHEDVTEEQVQRIRRSYLLGLPLYLLAGALAFVSPYLTLLLLLGSYVFWARLPHARGHVWSAG